MALLKCMTIALMRGVCVDGVESRLGALMKKLRMLGGLLGVD